MVALDTLVVATALTTIRHDLDASVEQLEWTVNAYNLSFAVLLMTGVGARRPLRPAPDLRRRPRRCSRSPPRPARSRPAPGALIAARAVQGMGAAFVMPLALTLVGAAFPPEKRGAAMGALQGLTGLAVAGGPVIGGAVAEGLAWQWIFWINVPIGLLAVPLVLAPHPRESRGTERRARPPRPRADHRRARSASSGASSAATAPAGAARRSSRSLAAGALALVAVRRLASAARATPMLPPQPLPLARVLPPPTAPAS